MKEKMLTWEMWISCVIGLISGLIIIPITSNQSLFVIILTIFLIISIIYIWRLHIKLHQSKSNIECFMPRLSQFIYNEKSYSIKAIVINTDLMSNLSFVTFYMVENDVEFYLGTGKIINIQSNNMAQVEIIDINSNYNDELERIKSNDITLIKSIIVKLGIHEDFIKKRH